MPPFDEDDRDWRLTVRLPGHADHRALHTLVERAQDEKLLDELRVSVGEDVVVTHDGDRVFAYASGREAIERARTALQAVLDRDGLEASMTLTHFSGDVDEWVDPDAPLPPAASAVATTSPQSRTLVATVGRMIREEFEQSLRGWADQLGLRCEIVEHPHLLSTQVAFTVTGPRRKLEEFASALRAEERATIRTEREVMLSPL